MAGRWRPSASRPPSQMPITAPAPPSRRKIRHGRDRVDAGDFGEDRDLEGGEGDLPDHDDGDAEIGEEHLLVQQLPRLQS